ncbi:MAG: DegV family protein [Oscillospiraceae bacterium]|nr:DegV family protein [Oscillospiraceae bacterium]MDD3832593.1 DegV family protein [Oscillospiraceae bacterium]MDD4546896.1 DegV family protein [Oscillospiraceae bacterium]
MNEKIILSADSTCDLGEELKERYSVNCSPLHVILGDDSYLDGVDLTADRIYEIYSEKKILPKTAAINVAEYYDYFRKWTEQGYEIVHITIGHGLSACNSNCQIAAKELPGVYVIDSCNLSTGSGHLVIQAAERIAAGMPAQQIADEVQAMTGFVQASFVLDTLEFLYKGGRCSALQMLGANMLQLKPCIEVNNNDGTMGVGKKYRGSLDKALVQYVHDQLSDRNDIRNDRIFLTHAGISEQRIELVRSEIVKLKAFKEILVTRAGCTISSHCGPNTLGILFMTNNP